MNGSPNLSITVFEKSILRFKVYCRTRPFSRKIEKKKLNEKRKKWAKFLIVELSFFKYSDIIFQFAALIERIILYIIHTTFHTIFQVVFLSLRREHIPIHIPIQKNYNYPHCEIIIWELLLFHWEWLSFSYSLFMDFTEWLR